MDKVHICWKPILPLLYDSSLSLMEYVGKLAHKVNEMIDAYNSVVDPINNIQSTINLVNATATAANTAVTNANTALATTNTYATRITNAENNFTSLNAKTHINTDTNYTTAVTLFSGYTTTVYTKVKTYNNGEVHITGHFDIDYSPSAAINDFQLPMNGILLPVSVNNKYYEMLTVAAKYGTAVSESYPTYVPHIIATSCVPTASSSRPQNTEWYSLRDSGGVALTRLVATVYFEVRGATA